MEKHRCFENGEMPWQNGNIYKIKLTWNGLVHNLHALKLIKSLQIQPIGMPAEKQRVVPGDLNASYVVLDSNRPFP